MNETTRGMALKAHWKRLDKLNYLFNKDAIRVPSRSWGLCSLIEADNSAGATNAPKPNES